MAENTLTPEQEPRGNGTIETSSYPFYVWSGLLTPRHRKNIGIAVWVYLWCLRRTTGEENGVGFVLGGRRIKIERIARELGVTNRTVGADLRRLQKLGYLQIRRIPYGLVIAVLKSKRGFEGKRSEEGFRSQTRRKFPISSERSEESFREDRKESSEIKERTVGVNKEKRVSSGSASPHRKAGPARKGSSLKPKEYCVDEVIYA